MMLIYYLDIFYLNYSVYSYSKYLIKILKYKNTFGKLMFTYNGEEIALFYHNFAKELKHVLGTNYLKHLVKNLLDTTINIPSTC